MVPGRESSASAHGVGLQSLSMAKDERDGGRFARDE
jgi:hypothetical protein